MAAALPQQEIKILKPPKDDQGSHAMLLGVFELLELGGCLFELLGHSILDCEYVKSRERRSCDRLYRRGRLFADLSRDSRLESVDRDGGTLGWDPAQARFGVALGNEGAVFFPLASVRGAEPLPSAPRMLALHVQLPEGPWHRTVRFRTQGAADRWRRRLYGWETS